MLRLYQGKEKEGRVSIIEPHRSSGVRRPNEDRISPVTSPTLIRMTHPFGISQYWREEGRGKGKKGRKKKPMVADVFS